MNVGHQYSDRKIPASKISILDTNSERRTLRKKIMALRGVEVIGASDLMEASSIWQRDRYDMVLLDIRMDHRGCMAFRDEIKKDNPRQVVAFLVGKPNYVEIDPSLGSYLAENYGAQWGDSLRKAVRESCDLLPQRYSFVEASWRIAAGRRINGAPHNTSETAAPANTEVETPTINAFDFVPEPGDA
jgi:CheY-like chemotaxis protein